jgi:glycosyltransferase involved in cell wall biosynthesis
MILLPVQKDKFKEGIYVMTDEGCLSEQSGAFVHINVGIEELSKHFRITILADKRSNRFVKNNRFLSKISFPHSGAAMNRRVSGLKGALSDIKTLVVKAIELPRFYVSIRRSNPDFIYERASYLNFNALIVCRLLRIPHFYEVNGILNQDIKMYYPSFVNGLVRFLENKAYRKSTYCFCVGGVGDELDLKTNHFLSVQNGVKASLLRLGEKYEKNSDYSEIRICYVGYVMKHHSIDYLRNVFLYLEGYDIHFHFFGKGFGQISSLLPSNIRVTDHGVVPETDLIRLLSKCRIAIIPQMQKEGSNMKIFIYAASKLLVILPKYPNVKGIFKDQEHVLFFEANNMRDCANKVLFAIKNPDMMDALGENLNKYVAANFTWEIIFDTISEKIDELLITPRTRNIY